MSSKFLAMDEWLRRIGLRHPFRSATTSEQDAIDQLCDPFSLIGDLLSSPDGHIIWGKPGTGKSAYRYILAQTVAAGAERWLVVELCRRELAAGTLRRTAAQRSPDGWFAALVVDCALAKLGEQSGAEQFAQIWPQVANATPASERLSRHHKASEAQLGPLSDLIIKAGYAGCMILVDEVDDVREARANPQRQRELIRPLFSEWLEQPGWRWRAFLPESLRSSFTGQHAISPRVQQWSLEWRPEHLRHMIADRLLFYSEQQQYETIGDLCDEELSPVVDAELIALSQGNPRDAITLASMLFRQHCQKSPIPRLIERVSWQKVCAEWESRTRREAEGQTQEPRAQTSPANVETGTPSAAPKPVAAEPAQLYFDEAGAIWLGATEITKKLSKSRYRLLKLLYEHQGQVVEKQQLIDAGWPPAEYPNSSSVEDDMIRQQINHLRNILSAETEYIESVSGRGYRLFAGGLGARKTKRTG